MTRTDSLSLGGAITGLTSAIMGLLVALGVHVPEPVQSATLSLVGAVIVLVSILLPRLGIDRARIVEHTPDGHTVLAGDANELATGTIIRDNLGTLPRHALE